MVAEMKKIRRRRLGNRLLALLSVLCVLAAGLLLYGFSNLNPTLLRMAEARSRQLAVEAINVALNEVMGEGVLYTDLMTVVMDQSGNVSMIQANTMRMNDLAAQVSLVAQRNLGQLADQGVKIPLGSAMGIGMFSGTGPDITVRVVPVGWVTTRFTTQFQAAGINQTRHEITLETTTTMSIVVPMGASPVSLTVTVPIAESIIVGTVPDTYINTTEEDAMNLVP